MNISNINTENGFIYFHSNSIPYHLENMNNEYAINKVLKKQEGFELSDYELEHTDFVNEYEQYLDLYILEMKDEWQEVESADTDCYLESIDEDYFDSEFCEVYFNSFSAMYYFLFKINNSFVRINISTKNNIEITQNDIRNNSARTGIKLEFEESNEVFQSTYRESNSYLAHIAKEILIRSHQDYLYSKEQVVVKL